ncbi:MAG: GNAT family N-acetyltransferase [Chloroflexi bacterium]|nr:GNAT family N-acetyltransferase [Chloroflexota bacterium]
MITYSNAIIDVRADQLQGFFQHWGKAPSPSTLLRILQGSDHVVLARETATGAIVGYITAISDGISCAYIPHLEVRADWRGQGIGSVLVARMLAQLRELYMIDLMCDADVMPFYERSGFQRYTGMIVRNYERQTCE